MTNWEKTADSVYIARLPGLRLVVVCSHHRYACTRRWGWIIGGIGLYENQGTFNSGLINQFGDTSDDSGFWVVDPVSPDNSIGAEAAAPRLVQSRITRYSSAKLAMAGALRHVRQHIPKVWQAEMTQRWIDRG